MYRFPLIAALLVASTAVHAQELIPADSAAWSSFAPRAQNAPVAERVGPALKLASGDKPFVYGGWRCRVEGLEAGAFYRFRARAITKGITRPRESVTVQLRWHGSFGGEVAPTYVWDFKQQPDGAIDFDRVAETPRGTRAVDVELVLQWTRSGEVTWQGISLTRAPAPAPRKVKIAAVWLRPSKSGSGRESAERFAEYTDRVAAEHHPDLILLGETINHVGAPGEFEDQAEPIPGPVTRRFSELAVRHSAYIVFGMVERDGRDIFNTSVLVDRKGAIAGKYRKVQVPFEELSRGIAPGDSLPVFQTDFGTVGMMICHDASFPEPARELAMKGAEVILMPIWGGRQALVRARAIENGVYLATSGYDYDSEIIDPIGRVLASVPHDKGPGVAVAEFDLSQTPREAWIGNWRDTVNQQRRSSPYSFPK